MASGLVAGDGLTAAADADQRIIYNTLKGDLYYDRDSLGGVAAVRFATITYVAALTHDDFWVF